MIMNGTKISALFIAIFSFLNISCVGSKSPKAYKILVTAPTIYNSRLSHLIDQTEGKIRCKAIELPMIETNLIENNTAIDSVLLHLNDYSWIALTSRNAIKAYFQRADELGLKRTDLKDQTYCAIGKDQDYLKSFGMDKVLTNKEPSPQGIVNTLKGISHTAKRIAVLCPQVIGLTEPNVVPNFLDSLRSLKLQVTRINAYTTSIHHSEKTEKVMKELEDGSIDMIAFTSSAEVEGLLSIIHEKKSILKNVNIACFGPYTRDNAIRLGLHPCLTSSNFSSFDHYVKAITNFFNKESI